MSAWVRAKVSVKISWGVPVSISGDKVSGEVATKILLRHWSE